MTIARLVIDNSTGASVLIGPDNPSSTGADAPIGSLYGTSTSGTWYAKFGPAITDWTQFAASTGYLPLAGGSLNAGANLTVPGLLSGSTGKFASLSLSGGLTASGASRCFGGLTVDTGLSMTAAITTNANNIIANSGLIGYDTEVFTAIGRNDVPHYGIRWGTGSYAGANLIMMLGSYGGVSMMVNGGERLRLSGTNQADIFGNFTVSGLTTVNGGVTVAAGGLGIIQDNLALSSRPTTTGAANYWAWYDSTGATRRGYVGFGGGTGAGANLYLNSDTGAIVLQTTAGTPTATFSTAGNSLNYALAVTGNVSSTGAFTHGTVTTAGGFQLLQNSSPDTAQLQFGTDGTGYCFGIAKNQGGTVTTLARFYDGGAGYTFTLYGTSYFQGGMYFNGLGMFNYDTNGMSFLTPAGAAWAIRAKYLLCSDAYADESLVPALGIYSKGNMKSGGTVTATDFILA